MLRFSRPYPGLDDTREWGGFDYYRYSCWFVGDLLVTLGTDGDYGLWAFMFGTPEFCSWFISGFRLFRIPGLN